MKTIISMLAATILALYTFCSVCWYAPSEIFDSVMPFVFVALFAYLLAVYVVYRSRGGSRGRRGFVGCAVTSSKKRGG
ncbi:MAG: hypothetical protein KAU52_08840 [Methanosarcinales archaeon]|nr:hypothetical protein [Methanosarcinales archaeon]